MVVFGCALAQSVRFWWLLFVQWKVKAFNNQQCKCTSVLKNCHLKKFILSIGSKCIYMCFGFSVSRCNSQKKTFVTARHLVSSVSSPAKTHVMHGMI